MSMSEKGLKFPLAREPYKTACSISSCFRKRLHSFSSSLSVNPYIAQSNKDGVFKASILYEESNISISLNMKKSPEGEITAEGGGLITFIEEGNKKGTLDIRMVGKK